MKRILSILIMLCTMIVFFSSTAFASVSFTDIKSTDWFYDKVLYVYEKGLMQGTTKTTFAPHNTTTRGMIVTILHRLEGEPKVAAGNPFTDVVDGSWYDAAITWAAERGIVSGYSASKFGPNDPITREQMATILYRYASHKNYDISASADLGRYKDANQISSYAVTSMTWANAEGLIRGMSDTILSPRGSATRAQVATILTQFCGKFTIKWKEAYINYVKEHGNVHDSFGDTIDTYKLVNINNDSIPELYINYGTTAGGDVICTYDEGKVVEQPMWVYGFSYIEGQNIFCDFGGHMDVYYDKIYSIKNGKFVLLYEGNYGASDNTHVQFDSDGNPIYNYYWNGTKVSSEAEYINLLNEVYNTQQAITPFDGAEYNSAVGRYEGNGLCGYGEIIRAINAY